MTDAHAKAVEAAAGRLASDYYSHVGRRLTMKVATRMTERALDAMAEAGWVMVRDVGGTQPATVPWRYGDTWDGIQDGVGIGTLDALCNGYADGWNACRAAMLKGSTDAG